MTNIEAAKDRLDSANRYYMLGQEQAEQAHRILLAHLGADHPVYRFAQCAMEDEMEERGRMLRKATREYRHQQVPANAPAYVDPDGNPHY